MVNNDTAELLKECDQGIKMGIDAIDEDLKKLQEEEKIGLAIKWGKTYRPYEWV